MSPEQQMRQLFDGMIIIAVCQLPGGEPLYCSTLDSLPPLSILAKDFIAFLCLLSLLCDLCGFSLLFLGCSKFFRGLGI